jgi:hypothetical protein
MRERLLTLLCALAALCLFGTLFLHGAAPGEQRAAAPTTAERAENGLSGALLWLHAEGIRTVSLRERFGALSRRRDLADQGNLLIVTLPAVTNFRSDELVALERWVQNGNTLLVMATLLDRPGWAKYPFMLSNDLRLLTGLSTVGPKDSEQAHKRVAELMNMLPTAQREVLVPNRAHPFFAGVSQLVGFSDYPPRPGSIPVPRDGFALVLAHQSASGREGFWLRPQGAGTIIVSGLGTLFNNRALGVADNARLLANLVGTVVGPSGAVIFDDEHQGLSFSYDPDKFFADPRLYATLAVIGCVWLAWVLGGTRLRMPNLRSPSPREAELVRTTGLFLARVLRPAAAAGRMFEQFLGRLRARASGPDMDGAALWQWLENHPLLAPADVAQLRRWYAEARAGRRVPLLDLHNLIVRTERKLAA